MRRRVCTSLGVLGAVLLLSVSGCGKGGKGGSGRPAPPLQIAEWLKGDPITLEDGRGKTTFVVEFWATTCPPCKYSIPHLSDLQARFADRGLVVIGITPEPCALARPFVQNQTRMNYRVACDDGFRTFTAYKGQDTGVPEAFVVNKDGEIVWHGHPMDPAFEAALKRTL